MSALLRLLFRLTGGRPMRFVERQFLDVVNGRYVNLYQDRLGRYWLGQSPWEFDRVEQNGPRPPFKPKPPLLITYIPDLEPAA